MILLGSSIFLNKFKGINSLKLKLKEDLYRVLGQRAWVLSLENCI